MGGRLVLKLESIVKTFPGVKVLTEFIWSYMKARFMLCAEKTEQENRP